MLPLPAEVIHLTEQQLREAARRWARAEGWDPDSRTPKNRRVWEAYAEQLTTKILPALNHALEPVDADRQV